MTGTQDQETEPAPIELADLDAHPDAVLARALERVAGALARVRTSLAAGSLGQSERDWARVVVQSAAGLHSRAEVPDLAAYLLGLAEHHVEQMTAARTEREEDAHAAGRTVDYVSTLPTGTSRWLQIDVPHRIARVTDAKVSHVVANPRVVAVPA